MDFTPFGFAYTSPDVQVRQLQLQLQLMFTQKLVL
jgi:hypothetical protein